MARLLTNKDYNKVTQSDAVRELIADNINQWLDAEQAAQLEMASYLKQRYIINQIFTDTTSYDETVQYSAKNLIQYHEADWSDLTTYSGYADWVDGTTYSATNTVNYLGYRYTSLGNGNTFVPTDATKWAKGNKTDRVNYKGYIYECNAVTTGFVPTNTTYWTLICEDYTLYYVTLPNEEWDKATTYAVGDTIWFLNKNYTALESSLNILPTANSNVWGTGTTYTISAGIFPQDTDYWTLGDNRNALLVRLLLDITAYHFMRSVPARAIPDHIKEAYNGNSPLETGGAIGWLKNVSKGLVSTELPEIIALPLYSVMHGQSRDKQDNLLW